MQNLRAKPTAVTAGELVEMRLGERRLGRQEFGGRSFAIGGGLLTVEWLADDAHVLMTGPAETVFEGEIEL